MLGHLSVINFFQNQSNNVVSINQIVLSQMNVRLGSDEKGLKTKVLQIVYCILKVVFFPVEYELVTIKLCLVLQHILHNVVINNSDNSLPYHLVKINLLLKLL